MPQSDSESEQDLEEHEKNPFFPRGKRKTKSNYFDNFLRTLSSFVVKLHCIDVNFLRR